MDCLEYIDVNVKKCDSNCCVCKVHNTICGSGCGCYRNHTHRKIVMATANSHLGLQFK